MLRNYALSCVLGNLILYNAVISPTFLVIPAPFLEFTSLGVRLAHGQFRLRKEGNIHSAAT